MSWNYRALAHEYNGEVCLKIHEVYYNKDGVPDGYTANPITLQGETLKEINWKLNKIKEALKKPPLWEGDKFPNEFKLK